MNKFLIVLVLTLFFLTTAFAQKGGLIYYLKNSGKLVSTKDSSDYSMVVLPPDTSVDKKLYVVYVYDKNGKVMLVTNSYTRDINLKFQGRFIAYFPDGKKKRIGSYIDQKYTGMEVDYYPNGKVYITKNYLPDGKVFFRDCSDSTGSVLAENGKGKWVEYNDDFKVIISEGNIINGLQDGEWDGSLNKYENFKSFYKKGKMQNTVFSYKPGIDTVLMNIKYEKVPEFSGGINAFTKFLGKNLRYPVLARNNHIKGRIIVSLVVEKDGTLTCVKIKSGIGYGCDEECIRVMRISPPWNPAIDANGNPVRIAYNVPITFALSN